MRALALVALLCAGAGLALAGEDARAAEVLVVLDRGSDAQGSAERDAQRAVRLSEALERNGHDVRLVVYGTRPDGRPRIAYVRGEPAKALPEQVAREGWQFEGPTDPRTALARAFRLHVSREPLWLVLVGPFAGVPAQVEDGRRAWNERAPAASRILPIGLTPEALGRIEEARGLVRKGEIVLGAGPALARTEPFSPLREDDDAPPLEAVIEVPLDVVPVGMPRDLALLLAQGDPETDDLADLGRDDEAASVARFRLRRSLADGRKTTVSFRPNDALDNVLWLGALPASVEITWRDLVPDARLRSAEGGAAGPFTSLETVFDAPRVVRYRLVRTNTGPAPAWVLTAASGERPEGFSMALGPEVVEEGLVTTEVRIAFVAARGPPFETRGTLRLSAPGHPAAFDVPYHVEVPPGRVTVVLERPDGVLALPPAAADPTWQVGVEAGNANAPDRVQLALEVAPPELASHVTARLDPPGRRVRAGETFFAVVGEVISARLESGTAPPGAEGTARFVLVQAAAVLGAEVEPAPVRVRRPRLVADTSVARYRVEDGHVVADRPLRVHVDPDGGDGAWRRALYDTAPTTEVDAPVGWQWESPSPGAWTLVPVGPWRGARRDLFRARTEPYRARVAWSGGPAPGAVELTVEVPPRWGAAGWVLVGLAGLALVLVGVAVVAHRTPRVTGSLLYAAKGLEGAVGRLDLSGVGRRRRAVVADARGRLALGGPGREILVIRPTRVGGILEVPPRGKGAEGERRLLVDGLSLQVGRHRVRYVSGRPSEEDLRLEIPEVPDLLGPEYDLAGGRIDALAPEAPGALPEGAAAAGGETATQDRGPKRS
ncbi:MAG: hypothetical protein ACYTG6_01015 [Planctomycetota bacterium]|jgi:hypothetical protein